MPLKTVLMARVPRRPTDEYAFCTHSSTSTAVTLDVSSIAGDAKPTQQLD